MKGKVWTKAEVRILRQFYPWISTREIAEELGRSVSRVHAKANSLGLRKEPEGCDWPAKGQIRPEMQKWQFPKGNIPANKGLRRPGWSAGRMRETQFKPGQRPHTWHPVGTILPDADGYLRIKIRERRPGDNGGWDPSVWPPLHRCVWEIHRGPIPPGHIVTFKDRNREHCNIRNLKLLSMADNARRNAMWGRYPKELSDAIMANAALKRQIRRLDGKEQNHRPAGPPV